MKRTPLAAPGLIVILSTAPALAVTDTWDGGGADNNISTGLNWLDNTAPASDLASTDLIFAGVVDPTPNFAAVFSANSVVFNNTAGAFSCTGSALTLGTGGLTNNDTDTQTFSNPINFGAATSTINAANGPLVLNGTVSTGTTTVTMLSGASSLSIGGTLTGTGTLTKSGSGTLNLASTATAIGADLNLDAGVTALAAGTTQTFTSGSTLSLGGGIVPFNESAVLDGGQFNRTSGALNVASGKILTFQNGADLNFGANPVFTSAGTIAVTGAGSTLSAATSFSVNGGATISVTGGGSLTSTGTLLLATNTNGTVTVDGTGSVFSAGSTVAIGQSGGDGTITLSNGSTGTVAAGGINVASTTGTGTVSALNILTGATMTSPSIFVAPGIFANTGTVTISGTGSTLTLNGTSNNIIGAANTSTATLNIQAGGTFNTSGNGSSTLTVDATGTVNLGGTGAVFNANGNVTVNGLLARTTGGTFNLATGKTLTIQNGGDFTSSVEYSHAAASAVTVTGAGSTLITSGASSGLRFSGGSTLTVLAGAQVSSGGNLSIGAPGDTGGATVAVSGAGSSLTVSNSNALIGGGGNTGTLTFSSNATGNLLSILVANSATAGSNGSLTIQSGATVTAGSLSIALAGGATTSGTATIDGAGSSLALANGGNIGIGTLHVNNGGTLSTGGNISIQSAGSLLAVGGELEMDGNVSVSGQMNIDLDSRYEQTSGNFTVSSGGDALFEVEPVFSNTTDITVSGAGSTLTNIASLLNFSGPLVNVLAGGVVAGNGVDIGDAVSTVVKVDGNGSQLKDNGLTTSLWGRNGADPVITFSNNASGSFVQVFMASTGNGTNATLRILSGADLTIGSGGLRLAPGSATTVAIAEVAGEGSTLTVGGGDLSVGNTTGGTGTLTIGSGGTVTLTSTNTNNLVLNTLGTVNLNGGSLILGDPILRAGGVLNFNSGLLSLDEGLTIGTGGLLGENLTLASDQRLIVGPALTTTVAALQTLTLDGGSLTTGALTNNGAIDFLRGTLAITGTGGFTIGSGALGSNVTLNPGALLDVANTTTINSGATLRVNGGAFDSGSIINNGSLRHDAGILTVGGVTNQTGGSVFITDTLIAGTVNNASGGRITLRDGTGRLGGGGTSLLNSGLVTGDGLIDKPLTNNAGGEVRAEAGRTLAFTNTATSNAGTFALLGGTLDFQTSLTNSPAGFITGRGALHAASLINQGVMAFSGGNADIFGDTTNATNARIVTSAAGSTTTFYDDVTHNGTEIFTGAGASTVFFGDQGGSGPFTGTGTVYYLGDLRPGNSPANISYGGNVVLGPVTELTMEVAGTTRGTQYDSLTISGTLVADGALTLTFLAPYVPAAGHTFDILDAAAISGTFDAVNLPSLPNGLTWDTTKLYTEGTLRITTPGVTFAEWAATALNDPSATPGGDHDHDGFDNGTEFALGLFPPQPGTVLPDGGSFNYPDGQSLRLLFTRPLDRTGVTLKVQAAADLVTWQDMAVSIDSAPFTGAGFVSENRSHPLNEPGLVEVRDILTSSTAPRRQIRLLITIAP